MNGYLMNLKLAFLREFQTNYPNSHVGGSIGLMLHGYDLKRDLNLSDLDIVSDVEQNFIEHFSGHDVMETSSVEDFETRYVFQHNHILHTKVEIRVSATDLFDVVEYNGHNYNVSKIADIKEWKVKYAKKGIGKHIQDLYEISNLIAPMRMRFNEFCELNEFPRRSQSWPLTQYNGADCPF